MGDSDWPKAVDMVSAAKRLAAELAGLAIKVRRQQNGDESECEESDEAYFSEETYLKGRSLCNNFVYNKTLCAPCLVYKLEKSDLQSFAVKIRKFLTGAVNKPTPDPPNSDDDYDDDDEKRCQRCGKIIYV